MIADWYFLNCLHFPPRRAATFLSIFEVIDAPHPDVALAVTAVHELEKAEISVQIYAVPKLARLLHRASDGSARLREVVLGFLMRLIGGAEDSMQQRLENFVRLFIAQVEGSDGLKAATDLAAASSLFSKPSVPYLDLKERMAETFLLAGLETLASMPDGDGAREIEAALSEGTGSIAIFMDAALDGKLGRLAFLQALRLRSEIRNSGSQEEAVWDDVVGPLVKLKGALPLDEPDLVQAAVRLRFKGQPDFSVEMLRLKIFRRLRRALQTRPRKDERQIRKQVAAHLGLDEEAKPVVQIVLWQAALAGLMAEKCPTKLADDTKIWWRQVPTFSPRWPMPVNPGEREQNSNSWFDCLMELVALRVPIVPERRAFYLVHTDADARRSSGNNDQEIFEKEVLPLLLSPWDESRKNLPQKSGFRPEPIQRDDSSIRGDWRQHLKLLRLCCATWQTLRLLENLQAGESGRNDLFELLAHFEDAVGQPYRRWLEDASRNDLPPLSNQKRLPLEFTSLTLFVRQQVMATIKGFRRGARPADFSNLSKGRADWLEEVLVRWVEEVFRFKEVVPAANEWLEELPKFAPSIANSRNDAVQQPAVLLLRLFAPNLLNPTDIRSQWQDKARNKIAGKDGKPLVRNREVLAAPFVTWEEWENYQHLVEAPAPVALQLTAAVERLLVLFPENESAEAVRNKWIDELASVLARVAEPQDVDRFVMVRLVDLISNSALRGRDETRLAIVRLLVERASSTALLKLMSLLLGPPVDEQAALVWPKLRIAALRGLLARAKLRVSEDASPQDPIYLLQGEREAWCFDKLAQLFLAGSAPGLGESEVSQLREDYLRMEHEDLNGFGRNKVRGIQDQYHGKLIVECEKDAPLIENWMLKQAVEDPDTGDFDLLFDVNGIPKRPQNSQDPRVAFLIGRDSDGLGMAVDQYGGWHQGIKTFAINAEIPGLPVSLAPIEKKVEQLNISLHIGDLAEVEVSRRNEVQDPGRLSIQPCAKGAWLNASLDLHIWDADLSRRFWEKTAPSRKVPAVYNGDGEWIPQTFGLSVFLCRTGGAESPPRATLTFIRRTLSNDGSEHWLFGGHPGELYEFSADEFEKDAAQEIREELKLTGEISSRAGLLISVEATRKGHRVSLVLVRKSWPESIHPDLQLPFDRRNLDWCQQFKADDAVRVEYDEELGEWHIPIEVCGGFPDRVRVRWSGKQPDSKLKWVPGLLCEWRETDQRRGWVLAKKSSYELNLANLPALFEICSNLNEGAVTKLDDSDEVGEQAEIACLTTEKLRVLVPLDSLTLLPIKGGEDVFKLARGRKLRFEDVQWQREETVQLTFEDAALPKLREGWNTGVLVMTPTKEDTSGLCKVLLNGGNDLCGVRIFGNDEIWPLYLGTHLRVEIKKGLVRNAAVQKFRIHATGALWSIETRVAPENGSFFVGECSWNNTRAFASESSNKPGILQLTPPNGAEPSLFARWDSKSGTWMPSSIGALWPAINIDKSRHFKYAEGKRLFRVRLVPRSPNWVKNAEIRDASLAGLCSRSLESPHCKVLKTYLRLEKTAVNEAAVWRIFDVDAQFATAPVARTAQIGLPEHLERLASTEHIQSCWVDSKGKFCQLTELQRAGFNEQQSTLPVAKNGGTWVTGRNVFYSPQGRGHIERIAGQWTIDFRRVKSLTPEEYRNKLGAALDEPQFSSLFVVGPIMDATLERKPNIWRFEAGYGLSVDIPENRLWSHGRPFNLRHLLFHGDKIKEFKFVEITDKQSGASIFGIDINDVAIEPAPATVLYRQAKRFKVVHTLTCVMTKGSAPEIVSIRGCDERRVSGAEDRFTVPHASLDQKSVTRLAPRFNEPQVGEASEEGSAEKVIYGRMNVDAFELSHGLEVQFEHISLTKTDQTGLQGGELLLLQAVRLELAENDVFLQFEDIAREPEDLLVVTVTRRNFSCRESLLRRLSEDEGEFEKEVRNHIFAVRLDATPDSYGSFRGSLRNKIPDRRNQALKDHVGLTGEPVFAVVVGSRERRDHESSGAQTLRLEHRPGIFFSLTASDFSGGRLPTLAEGTLVQAILTDDARFQLLACSYGDREYFKTGSRLVVAFPMNPLLYRESPTKANMEGSTWWEKKDRFFPGFSLGDFPGTICLAKSIDREGRIQPPNTAAMFDFMGRRHPKIGLIIYDQDRESNSPVLIPDIGLAIVGALDLGNQAPQDPFLISEMEPRTQLEWMALTFSDASVSEIVKRFRDLKWHYHDDTTGGWKDGIVVRGEPTLHHTLSRGPLFFDKSASGFRLRYRHESLMSWAIPVGDLLGTLGRNRQSFSVAGSVTIEGQGGLYVEYLPGRILHLPGALFFWRLKTGRVPLARLDWRHFAEGDTISIRVNEGAVLAPDYLDLEDWNRGSRACFGRGRVLLPVVGFDAVTGALRLGGGAFQLTLPCTKQIDRKSIWLHSDNRLEDFDAQVQTPGKGDCCLLGIDPLSGQLIVLGLPEFKAEPERATYHSLTAQWHGWETEVFLPVLAGEFSETNWSRLFQIVSAAGGVMPATVERVSRDKKIVFFSFRQQSNDIARGHLALATVLGYLPESRDDGGKTTDKLLLRVGGGIAFFSFDKVISGVPRSFHKSVATGIAEKRAWVWLAADANGNLSIGLRPDTSSELTITPVIISQKDDCNDSQWGMVVRSDVGQNYYWIPDTETAWVSITAADARTHFLQEAGQKSFNARKIIAGDKIFLSFVVGHGAVQESEGLRPGCELSVFVRQALESKKGEKVLQSWLVESSATGLLLLLETTPDDEPDMLKASRTQIALRAEIAFVRRGRRGARQWQVITVPTGKRVHRLSLPSRFSQLTMQTESDSFWKTQSLWLAEVGRQPWDESRLANSQNEPLGHQLIHAAALSKELPESGVVWQVAKQVLDQLKKSEEVPLISALLALEILVDHVLTSAANKRDPQNELLQIVDVIGRRALRSLHLEALEEAIQSHNLNSSAEAQGIWNRVERILHKPLDANQMVRMNNLLKFAMIAGDDIVRSISTSIYLATGKIPEHGLDSGKSAEVLSRLIGWHRVFGNFFLDSHDSVLPPKVIHWLNDELKTVLLQVRNRSLGIVLLSPLPPISIEVFTEPEQQS
jgi:hypothetical protein